MGVFHADGNHLHIRPIQRRLRLERNESRPVQKRREPVIGQENIALGIDVERVLPARQQLDRGGHRLAVAALAVDGEIPHALHDPGAERAAQEYIVGRHKTGRDPHPAMDLGEHLCIAVCRVVDRKQQPVPFRHRFA